MTYATRADLAARYGGDEIEQRESVLDEPSVERSLADADAEIDSYVGGLFAVPLSPVPPVIVRIACVLARYHLLSDSAPQSCRDAYKEALVFLREVQSGQAKLPSATPLVSSTALNRAVMTSAGRVFDRGSL